MSTPSPHQKVSLSAPYPSLASCPQENLSLDLPPLPPGGAVVPDSSSSASGIPGWGGLSPAQRAAAEWRLVALRKRSGIALKLHSGYVLMEEANSLSSIGRAVFYSIVVPPLGLYFIWGLWRKRGAGTRRITEARRERKLLAQWERGRAEEEAGHARRKSALSRLGRFWVAHARLRLYEERSDALCAQAAVSLAAVALGGFKVWKKGVGSKGGGGGQPKGSWAGGVEEAGSFLVPMPVPS